MIIDNIEVHNNLTYDFLASLYRLNNNEKMIDNISEYKDLVMNFKLNEDIIDWTRRSKKKISEEVMTKMSVFFDSETYYGMCLIPYIVDYKINSIEEFINVLKSIPPTDMLKNFIDTGYGPKDGLVSTDLVQELINNYKKATAYINDKISIPSKQKWDLLQFFVDPEKMKRELIELLTWFYENIYVYEEEKIKVVLYKNTKEIKNTLAKYGNEYLELLFNIKPNKLKNFRRVILILSYSYEFGSMSSSNDENDYIFLIGYRYQDIFVKGKHDLLSNVQIFKALADETRLNIIKLLSKKSMYGREIAQELELSNSNISYHTSMLIFHNLIINTKEDNKTYFSLDKEELRKVINSSIDKLII
ncbi:ArsR/SmtB family transcription factor [Alkaliphilus peptidifermentans]|uniref:DNA-binding transcriptional regulator, ArsR family n=1 Tax=Alkaliphilus peptidifermentans DSM 18978 TaxID=1120976 RepID=A0A1G5H893_9FIRM|nr:metalloregulator ArsR/SmtB family transcription factor [Alkaliphilus peptidifermentans]SCY59934.1 DNA-binding transcriptional regulator, ArsR family [Alkaliphilus peptidifermentans DSM 18978]